MAGSVLLRNVNVSGGIRTEVSTDDGSTWATLGSGSVEKVTIAAADAVTYGGAMVTKGT